MCDYDGDPPEFCSEKSRKARKTYHCCECPTTIGIGDTYRLYAGKWDDFQWYRRCQKCALIADAMNDIDCSWTFRGLLEGAEHALDNEEHEAEHPEAFERLRVLLGKHLDEVALDEVVS